MEIPAGLPPNALYGLYFIKKDTTNMKKQLTQKE